MKALTKNLILFAVIAILVIGGHIYSEHQTASYYGMSVQNYLLDEYVDDNGTIYKYDSIHKVMVPQVLPKQGE